MIPPPCVFAFTGTSLTTGRLSADWVPRLLARLPQEPECQGQVIIHNMGRGSQTSDWGVTNAPNLSALKPNFILFEDFGINDCAIGPVTLSQAAINFDTMVTEWRAKIPGVSLTHQTMSPASASDANRTNLLDYYGQGLTKAAAAGIPSLNHTPNWPTNLDASNTYGAPSGDGLHPIWPGVFETFSYPLILSWAKSKMAEHWA